MSESERRTIVDQLPSEFPCETAPEGDRHRIPKEKAVESLGEYFRRMGRRGIFLRRVARVLPRGTLVCS